MTNVESDVRNRLFSLEHQLRAIHILLHSMANNGSDYNLQDPVQREEILNGVSDMVHNVAKEALAVNIQVGKGWPKNVAERDGEAV